MQSFFFGNTAIFQGLKTEKETMGVFLKSTFIFFKENQND
jgi:hypothetical protein